MGYMGGSAYAMARDISEGYILLNPTTLRKLTVPEAQQLKFELEKNVREARALQPSQEDAMAQQQRNRRILRIQQAMTMIENYIQQRR